MKKKVIIVCYDIPEKTLPPVISLAFYLSENSSVDVVLIVREISKIYEEVFRGTLEEAIKEFTNRVIKGEFVICIDKVE